MWGRQAEYAWAMPSTPASGRGVWISRAFPDPAPALLPTAGQVSLHAHPKCPAMARLGAPRGQGQGAPNVEPDRPEFKFCLCHFLAVGPGAGCLIFVNLFPCYLLRLIIHTSGQLAEGGPAGLAKPAMTRQGHRKPSGGPFWTRYGFCSGLLGRLRCLHSRCTWQVLCKQPPF